MGRPVASDRGGMVDWDFPPNDVQPLPAQAYVRRFAALEGALLVWADGTVASANPAAAELLGIAPDELVGAALHVLARRLASTGPTAGVPEPCPVAVALQSGLPVRDALVDITRPDGTARVLNVTCRPQVRGECVVSIACTFADVTVERPSHRACPSADVIDLMTVDLTTLPDVPALPAFDSPWARPLAS